MLKSTISTQQKSHKPPTSRLYRSGLAAVALTLGMSMTLAPMTAPFSGMGLGASHARADDIHVAASIRPIHSLVQMVLGDVGEAELMMTGTSSPHGGTMRPSERRILARADLVFIIDPHFESAYSKALPPAERLVALADTDGMTLLDRRPMSVRLDHDDHDHDDHDDHDEHDHGEDAHHDEHDEHDHGEDAHHEEHDEHDEHDHGEDAHHDEHDDHDEHDEHDDHGEDAHHDEHDDHDDHGEDAHHDEHDEHDDHDDHEHDHEGELVDLHVWLDPDNAVAMIPAIRDRLSARYPEHAASFAANAERSIAMLNALDDDLAAILKPVADKGFVTHHDAFAYLEAAYGLKGIASVYGHHGEAASARHLSALRHLVEDGEVVCMFREPQYSDDVMAVIDQSGSLKGATLDPLSADIEAGGDFYGKMMRRLASTLAGCLTS